MGRPRKDELRDHQLNIALTGRELMALRSRATAVRLALVDYARTLLMREPVADASPVQPDDERQLFQHLRRLGNNLNQIARMHNALRLPAPDSLEPLLDDIRRLLARRFDGDC